MNRLPVRIQLDRAANGQHGVVLSMAEIVAGSDGNAPPFPKAAKPRQGKVRPYPLGIVAEEQTRHALHERLLLDVRKHRADVRLAAEHLVILNEKHMLFPRRDGIILRPQQKREVARIAAREHAPRPARRPEPSTRCWK